VSPPTSFDARTATGVENPGSHRGEVRQSSPDTGAPTWNRVGRRRQRGTPEPRDRRCVRLAKRVSRRPCALSRAEGAHAAAEPPTPSSSRTKSPTTTQRDSTPGGKQAGRSGLGRPTSPCEANTYTTTRDGLWTDIDNIHAVYGRNRAIGSSGVGIFHEISSDTVIRRNHVASDALSNDWIGGAGNSVAHSPNVRIYRSRYCLQKRERYRLIHPERGSGHMDLTS
jgi:hypothetical protein